MSYKYLVMTKEELIEAFGEPIDLTTVSRDVLIAEGYDRPFDEEGKLMSHWNYGGYNFEHSNEKNKQSNIYRLYNTEQGKQQREALGKRQKGSNNITAKKTLTIYKGITRLWGCLDEFYKTVPHIPRPTLYCIAQDGRYSKRYDLYAEYVIDK